MGKRVGLMAGLMVVALGSGAVAQEPSPEPPPWFGGRVEMPEHGFAVTLPDDWVAFDTTVDVVRQVEAASSFVDPAVWSAGEADLVGWLAGNASAGLQLGFRPVTGMDMCMMGAPPYVDVSAEDAADLMYETSVDDPGSRDVEEPQRIDLRAGPAYLTRLSVQDAPDVWWSSAQYWLGTDEVVLGVFCMTDGDRPDDWLSIAETIEFLPAEE